MDTDAFETTKAAFVHYGLLYQAIAAELGLEMALQLLKKPWEQRATAFATRLRDQGMAQIDLLALTEANEGYRRRGYDRVAEVTDTSIIYKTHACPFYEALRQSGLDHESTRSVCQAVADSFDEALKEILDPRSAYLLRFRPSEDEFCVEEVCLRPDVHDSEART